MQDLLNVFKKEVYNILGDKLKGIYLTGSIVLNEYYENKSDIDFTVVIAKKISTQEIVKLRVMHQEIMSRYNVMMDGHYITEDILGKGASEVPPQVAYYDGEVLENVYHNISFVTWLTLQRYGKALYGNSISDLHVDRQKLKQELKENVNTYWDNYVQKLEGQHSIDIEDIEWCVLGLSRIYYTLREEDIIAKGKAGAYARQNVPKPYHSILDKAIQIRGIGGAYVVVGTKDKEETISYMRYLIKECNSVL